MMRRAMSTALLRRGPGLGAGVVTCGTLLAYTAFAEGDDEIFVIGVQCGEPVRVTRGFGWDGDPSWIASPP